MRGGWLVLLGAWGLTKYGPGPAASLAGAALALALAAIALIDFIIKWWGIDEETFYLADQNGKILHFSWLPPVAFLVGAAILGHYLWT